MLSKKINKKNAKIEYGQKKIGDIKCMKFIWITGLHQGKLFFLKTIQVWLYELFRSYSQYISLSLSIFRLTLIIEYNYVFY